MKTITSVSGGRTSAFLAANYPADALIFALVRLDDENCRFPDAALRQRVEDKIQAPFVGTAEDDMIIYTLFDLEQYLGKEIHWVTGLSFEEVLKTKGGWLPNKLHRYCTTRMKFEPIFYWCAKNFGINNPVKMNIGYRANEVSRANRMLEKLNDRGFIEIEATFEKHPNGQNKWVTVDFESPQFPLIQDGVKKDKITSFWQDKPVRFADHNNCVGCFHREPIFLRYMFQQHPNKMAWFKRQEGQLKKFWRSDMPYARIEKLMPQMTFFDTDFSSCDSGYCEI
jgi:hypothetical protein